MKKRDKLLDQMETDLERAFAAANKAPSELEAAVRRYCAALPKAAMNKRGKLLIEIIQTVPAKRLIDAGAWMLLHARGKFFDFTTDDVVAFLKTLNVAKLEDLRRIALKTPEEVWLRAPGEPLP